MTNQSLQINLGRDGQTDPGSKRWVHLTQPVEDGMDQTASMFDVAQMIARARSGQSAFTYKKNSCAAGVDENGNVTVRLDFEAWPSFPSLDYTLEASFGFISPPEIIEEYTEFSTIFGKTDAVELDFILQDMSIAQWETGCFDLEGQPIYNQNIELDGLTTLRTDTKLFGVARIRGRKFGARHRVTTTLLKSFPVRPENPLPEDGITAAMLDEYWAYTDVATWNGEPVLDTDTINATGLSLDNLEITVTARWLNSDGEEETESMRLTVPQCVKDLLAACDGDLESFGAGGSGGGTKICDSDDRENHLTVYTSSCTGKVIEERTTTDDPDSWCE